MCLFYHSPPLSVLYLLQVLFSPSIAVCSQNPLFLSTKPLICINILSCSCLPKFPFLYLNKALLLLLNHQKPCNAGENVLEGDRGITLHRWSSSHSYLSGSTAFSNTTWRLATGIDTLDKLFHLILVGFLVPVVDENHMCSPTIYNQSVCDESRPPPHKNYLSMKKLRGRSWWTDSALLMVQTLGLKFSLWIMPLEPKTSTRWS